MMWIHGGEHQLQGYILIKPITRSLGTLESCWIHGGGGGGHLPQADDVGSWHQGFILFNQNWYKNLENFTNLKKYI
jgi:hypothetical protein